MTDRSLLYVDQKATSSRELAECVWAYGLDATREIVEATLDAVREHVASELGAQAAFDLFSRHADAALTPASAERRALIHGAH